MNLNLNAVWQHCIFATIAYFTKIMHQPKFYKGTFSSQCSSNGITQHNTQAQIFGPAVYYACSDIPHIYELPQSGCLVQQAVLSAALVN
jgi:hypothetical protein